MGKSTCVFIFLILHSSFVFAQVNREGNNYIGLNQFNLGDPRSKFGSTIMWLDSSVWQNKLTTTYALLDQPKYRFGDVPFSNVLIIFDERDKLSVVTMSRIKFKADSTYTKKEAKRNIKSLFDYISEQVGKKVKKKVFFKGKTSISDGYEWEGDNSIIRLEAHTGYAAVPSFTVSLTWKK